MTLENQNQHEFKNQSKLKCVFSKILKVQKHLIHQKKPFKTNIVFFDGLSHVNNTFLSLLLESTNISLLSRLMIKK